jgi:hypothetical protein
VSVCFVLSFFFSLLSFILYNFFNIKNFSEFSKMNPSFRKSTLCFLWDPLLTLSNIRTNYSTFFQRPSVVIIGAGLWHLAKQIHILDIKNQFEKVRQKLELLFEKESLIFQLQAQSLSYKHGLYNGQVPI